MTNLKKLREKSGLSRNTLSEKAEISLRTLQAYETGARDINKAQAIILYKTAKALECQMEDLMELKDLD